MKTSGAVALLATIAAAAAAQPNAASGTRLVNVDGYAVHVQALGLDTRKAGTPVIVFESGARNALEVWGRVPATLAADAPVVAYDRAGLGKSAWDSVTPTPRHVTARLRKLLGAIGAAPPYILVGWSWGGTLMRYFAGYYPSEVAGVVFVDPGPIITESLADKVAPYEAIGAGRAGYDAFWAAFAAVSRSGPPAVRAEFDVFSGLTQKPPAERDLRPMPNVPVVMLVAARYQDLSQFIKVPYDQRAHFEADVRHRIKMLQEWALASPHGTVIVSNTTTHAIPRDDPELVVWATKRVLAASLTSR